MENNLKLRGRKKGPQLRGFEPHSISEQTSGDDSDSHSTLTPYENLAHAPDVRINARKSGIFKFLGVKLRNDGPIQEQPLEDTTPLQHSNTRRRRRQLITSTPFGNLKVEADQKYGDISSIIEKSPECNSNICDLEVPKLTEVQEDPSVAILVPNPESHAQIRESQEAVLKTQQPNLEPPESLSKSSPVLKLNTANDNIIPITNLVVHLNKEVRLMKSRLNWLKHSVFRSHVRSKLKWRKRNANRTINNIERNAVPRTLNNENKRRSKSLENLIIEDVDDVQDDLGSDIERDEIMLKIDALNSEYEVAMTATENSKIIRNYNLRESGRSFSVQEKSVFGDNQRHSKTHGNNNRKSNGNQIIEEVNVSKRDNIDSDVRKDESMLQTKASNVDCQAPTAATDIPAIASKRGNVGAYILRKKIVHEQDTLNSEYEANLETSDGSLSIKEKTLHDNNLKPSIIVNRNCTGPVEIQVPEIMMDVNNSQSDMINCHRAPSLFNLDTANEREILIPKSVDISNKSSNDKGMQQSCSTASNNSKVPNKSNIDMNQVRRTARRCRTRITKPDMAEFKILSTRKMSRTASVRSSKTSTTFSKKIIVSRKESVVVEPQSNTFMEPCSSTDTQEVQINPSNKNAQEDGPIIGVAKCRSHINRGFTRSQTICAFKIGHNCMNGIQIVGKMEGPMEASSNIFFTVFEGTGYLCDVSDVQVKQFFQYEPFLVSKGQSFILKNAGTKRWLLGYTVLPATNNDFNRNDIFIY